MARLSATKDLQPLALAVATYDRDPRVEMLLAHLRDDPSSTVAALAKQMGMGASVFSRWFRREVGKPCVVHVAELRVGQACELLLSTNRSVVDIAFSSGFRNLANFNRWFRWVKGVSPTEYRKSAESPT
ncbi:MAG TPA: AraC family transcriptional regulator [Planctomycetota bacterium]|nr:AraC family transcriptional regulator [Planctomycetota bacterium]